MPRADDELTLVTRDSVPSYQSDLTAVVPKVDTLLAGCGSTPAEEAALAGARQAWAACGQAHARVRAADGTGDLSGAIAVASGPAATDVPATSAAADRGSQLRGQRRAGGILR